METLTQFTKKEKALNRLAMFQSRVVKYGELINKARANENESLENIYITELMQCEKMVAICKEDLNNI
jgi:hypothetical protein